MPPRAPSVDEIKRLIEKSGLSLYEEGKGGLKIIDARTSVLIGEFDANGIQKRPGPQLERFLTGLPPEYFSPNQQRQIVKRGGGSAGEQQRKFTSIRARLKSVAARPKAYMGLETLDPSVSKVPTDWEGMSPGSGHKEMPRVITYVRKETAADGSIEYRRYLAMSEAPIVERNRADEILISYKLEKPELEIFSDPNFDEKRFREQNAAGGGFASFESVKARDLHLHIGDPNLEIEQGRGAKHFEKTVGYMEQVALALFDHDNPSSLHKKYGVPRFHPQDQVRISIRDQYRTKEWVKLSAAGASVSTLGRDVESFQKSVMSSDVYREQSEKSYTAVHLEYKFFPSAKSWGQKKYKPSEQAVRGGRLAESEVMRKTIDDVVTKFGDKILRLLDTIK